MPVISNANGYSILVMTSSEHNTLLYNYMEYNYSNSYNQRW